MLGVDLISLAEIAGGLLWGVLLDSASVAQRRRRAKLSLVLLFIVTAGAFTCAALVEWSKREAEHVAGQYIYIMACVVAS